MKFNVGLSHVIRYSYGAPLFVVIYYLLSPEKTTQAIKTIAHADGIWTVALGLVILSSAIYVLHRNVVIPIQHFLLCGLFIAGDCFLGRLKEKEASLSPTRFLQTLGVKRWKRIWAYNALRRSNFFPNPEALDIAHAENGVLVMTSVGLIIAGFVADGARAIFSPVTFLVTGIVLLGITFYVGWVQHANECLRIKTDEKVARFVLQRAGILP